MSTGARPVAADRRRAGGVLTVRSWKVAEVELDESVLDAAERGRVAALLAASDRRRYLAAHIALRRALGEQLGIAPGDVVFRREPCPRCGGPHGRPALAHGECGLHFSLSYSGEQVLVGIASAPIGVDVQRWVDPAGVQSLLHPSERTEIERAAPERRAAVFSRLWARKEAYLKGIGIGIVDDGLAGECRPAWKVFDVSAPPGYAAAVAVKAPV